MFMGLLIFFSGFMTLILVRKHYLMSLLSLEFFLISIFFLSYIYLHFYFCDFFFVIVFLVLGVCEGVLGLSLIVCVTRKGSLDYLSSLSLC